MIRPWTRKAGHFPRKKKWPAYWCFLMFSFLFLFPSSLSISISFRVHFLFLLFSFLFPFPLPFLSLLFPFLTLLFGLFLLYPYFHRSLSLLWSFPSSLFICLFVYFSFLKILKTLCMGIFSVRFPLHGYGQGLDFGLVGGLGLYKCRIHFAVELAPVHRSTNAPWWWDDKVKGDEVFQPWFWRYRVYWEILCRLSLSSRGRRGLHRRIYRHRSALSRGPEILRITILKRKDLMLQNETKCVKR